MNNGYKRSERLVAMFLRRAAILLASIVVAACFAIGCAGSPSGPGDVPVPVPSPARDIAGTWATFKPVTFIHQTDFCGRGIEEVGRSDWNVTWTVTAVSGFTNVVDVEMRFTRGSIVATGGCGGASG